MPDTARIAVIGTGWWSTTAHIPALQANPNADLVALADIRADAVEKAARHFGVERTYTDVHEMLARERLDGVVIAVWHAAHYEAARPCLEQGLHTVLENHGGSPLRQQWIERLEELGLLDSPVAAAD